MFSCSKQSERKPQSQHYPRRGHLPRGILLGGGGGGGNLEGSFQERSSRGEILLWGEFSDGEFSGINPRGSTLREEPLKTVKTSDATAKKNQFQRRYRCLWLKLKVSPLLLSVGRILNSEGRDNCSLVHKGDFTILHQAGAIVEVRPLRHLVRGCRQSSQIRSPTSV